MKRMILIKKLTLGLVIILYLFYLSPSKVFASNNVEMKNEDNALSYEFRPIIDKFSYNLEEIIQISFIVEADSQIDSIRSICEGFEEINKPFIDKNHINVSIVLNDKMDTAKYTLFAELYNGAKLESSIYGIVVNDKIYINCNSFFGAKDIYWAEKLNDNKNVEKINNEYKAYLNEVNSGALKENIYIDKIKKENFAKSGEDTYVSGLIRWFDDWSQPHPLQYTLLEIMDEGAWNNGLTDQLLGITYTDENGEYDFGFVNRSGGRNIYINIYAAGENSIVKTGSGNDYVLRTATTYGVTTGSTTIRNQDIVNGYDITHAFQISQAVNVSSRFVKEMTGSTISNVTVKYPHNENATGCFYRNNVMYIIGNRNTDNVIINGQVLHSYASWDVIQHEYNHHVQHYFNITNSPGGWHNGGNMYDHYMSHYIEGITPNCLNEDNVITCAHPSVNDAKDYAIRIAYAEAWPSVVGAISQQYAIANLNLDDNIMTVGDAQYLSYNGANINYETVDGHGDAYEFSVCGFLWDLYDPNNENHDEMSLGAYDYMILSINSEAKTLSELYNYYVNTNSSYYYISKIGRLSSFYQLGASNISVNLNNSNIPTISWIANGPSINLQNNLFYVIFYDCYQNEIMRINTTNTSITLSQGQWNSIIYSYGQTYYVTILSYQNNNPVTGGYYSNFVESTKNIEDINQNINISSNSRYYENVVRLAPGQRIDYSITFENAGNKTIQTFGAKDTYLYLYSQNGTLLASNDDSGYGMNALINYSVQANIEYIVRLKFYGQNQFGYIKLGILPTNVVSSNYEEIPYINLSNVVTASGQRVTVSQNSVYMYTITTTVSGNYHITTTQDYNCNITDTYLYFIDPDSTELCLYNDDGGNGLNAALTVNLIANKPYLVIVSPYNITNTTGDIWLTINKT